MGTSKMSQATCYATDIDTLKDEICTITKGYRIFNNVPGPRIGAKERENVAQQALLRLDRINKNTRSMVNIRNKALELAGRMSDAARLIVGGRHITSHAPIADIFNLTELALKLRKTVDDYDAEIMGMHWQSREDELCQDCVDNLLED